MKIILTLSMLLGTGFDCVTLPSLPAKPPQVVKVDGAFCGMVFDALGVQRNSRLDLFDDRSATVASTPVDATGHFRFANLPVGKYRARVVGFASTAEVVEITSSNQRECAPTLYIDLTVSSECAVSRMGPRRPDGK